MGIQDRDYMRERHRKAAYDDLPRDPPFSPGPAGPSTLVMVLTYVSVAFLLYRGYEWLQARQHASTPRGSSAVEMKVGRNLVRPEPSVAPPATVLQERVVATPPVRREPAVPVARPAPVQEERRDTPAPRTPGTIYLCKAYNGGTFWSQAHCGQHQALIDSIVPVPAGLPFQQQVELAEQRRQPTLAVSNTTVTVRSEGASGAAVRHAECKALDARVEQLDGMARQPQSGQMQDWIRGQRQEARDRQFALRC